MRIENKPVIVFDDLNVSHDELKQLFTDSEHEGYLWRVDFINAYFKGQTKLALKLAEGQNITLEKFLLDTMLEYFTLDNDIFHHMLNNVYQNNNNNFVKNVEYDNSQIIIDTAEGKIIANKLISCIPETKNIFPNINTQERTGMCHAYSIKFALNFDMKSELVTGYVAPLAEKNKNLHTWVEIKICDEDMVLDFTRGLMFNKKGYYILKNIKGPVNKISRETIFLDMFLFPQFAKYEPLLNKLYFANREQALQMYGNLKEKTKKTEGFSFN